jgi:hypothetical protein
MSLRPVMQQVLAQAQQELGNYKQLTKENNVNILNLNASTTIFDAIDSERCYQEQKWGSIEEHPQSVGGYLTLMRVHLTKAEAAWASSNNDKEALNCLRKVLALGVACGEQHGLPKRGME